MCASTSLPTAVACATEARPISARLDTLCGLGTKSTVTPSACAGSESVAVSPVSRTSCSSSGRARSRRSRRASAALPRCTSRSPSCQRLRAGLALDEAGLEQRGEHARDGARVDARAAARARWCRAGAPAAASASSSATARSIEPSGGSPDLPGGRSTLSTPPSITTVVPGHEVARGRGQERDHLRDLARPCRAGPIGIVAATSSTVSP